MVQILSIDTDRSTDSVIKWLNFYKMSWQRINPSNRNEIFFTNNHVSVIWFSNPKTPPTKPYPFSPVD